MFEDVQRTKEKIYRSAVRLFVTCGYDGVSMRELAADAGIQNPSFYYHFENKKEVLTGLYRIYEEQREAIRPDLDELLKMAETQPVHDVLMLADYHFDPSIEPLMNCIVAIAAHQMTVDEESQRFMNKNVLAAPGEHLIPVIERLIELGRIEPMDVTSFHRVIQQHCYAAVALCASPLTQDNNTWRQGLKYIYSLAIRPTGK